jgi:hypothetical protein
MSLGRFRFVLCAKLGGILPVASLLLPAQKRSQQVHDTRRLWSEARAAPRLMSGTISRHRGDSGRCAVWKSGAGCGGGDKHRPALASDARSAAGRPARTTAGLVAAATSGTLLIREECARHASAIGPRPSASRAPAGRRIRIGMCSDSAWALRPYGVQRIVDKPTREKQDHQSRSCTCHVYQRIYPVHLGDQLPLFRCP